MAMAEITSPSGVLASSVEDRPEWRAKRRSIEEAIVDSFHSSTPLIEVVGSHVLNSGGKRLRPMLLILSAAAAGYEGTEDEHLACVIEWIHAATLLHDDVLDDAELRRGRPTARAIWGNRISVFIGDYAYFQSVMALTRLPHALAECLLDACHTLVLGELLQWSQAATARTSEAEYLHVLECKTGALIAATCKAGGILAHAPDDECAALCGFGLHLGIAFQLTDDALDYLSPPAFGKVAGKDFQQGLLTLPLLHLLRTCPAHDRDWVTQCLTAGSYGQEVFASVQALLIHYGSLDYTLSVARDFVESAKRHLTHVRPSCHKETLFAIADFAVMRGH